MTNHTLEKIYHPGDFEDKIYEIWEKSGFFNPDSVKKYEQTFSIAMPPPNVTGSLHMGHSLMLVLQDAIVRYHRMKGDKTLWLPGTDHATISTQNKVERILAKEGKTRQQLGREAFLERVYAYIEQSRQIIKKQIKKVGASCDWSRERYTLDEGLSRAVSEIFVRMYQDGLIYRGNRMVHWCPRCISTLADDEVKHVEDQGNLYYIRYRIQGSDNFLTIATTRPETMLGDTAIAVNPNDSRYKEYIGKVAILPLVNRELPIIADEYVDPNFGTGSLKVTPAHDPNDFILGYKYKIASPQVIDESGSIILSDLQKSGIDITSLQKYAGLDRFDARKLLIEDLTHQGFMEKIEDYKHVIGHCYRCDAVIEPLISLQWFVSVDKKVPGLKQSLKQLAYDAVSSGSIKILPKRFEKNYFDWIENLHDWCISRQLWFGHHIPVYYCTPEKGGCGEITASVIAPAYCPKCKNEKLTKDQDTLDTWFSSGIWTFSTLGWPDNAEIKKGKIIKKGDLAQFHPTTVLETGYDIIFFWVARMVMMTCYAVHEVPFKTVYLNGLILDIEGKKMSKSKEEMSVNPLDVIEKYGTDALRLSMLVGVTPGNNARLDKEKIESQRNFLNKVWNISRFILDSFLQEKKETNTHTLSDTWILSRLHATVQRVTMHIEKFQFSQAVEELRQFTYDDLADWYVEIAKVEKEKQAILFHILETILALWHPFIPFATETIYQYYRRRIAIDKKHEHHAQLLMIHPWPKADLAKIHSEAEEEFAQIRNMITAIRNARSENNISPSQKIQAIIFAPTQIERIKKNEQIIKHLARLDFLTVLEAGEKPHNALYLKVDTLEVYLPLGLMKREEEQGNIQKRIEMLTTLIAGIDQRFANQEFLSRAPKNVLQKEKEKRDGYASEIAKLEEQLKKLR
jgi:valyl-tRNA synthetase